MDDRVPRARNIRFAQTTMKYFIGRFGLCQMRVGARRDKDILTECKSFARVALMVPVVDRKQCGDGGSGSRMGPCFRRWLDWHKRTDQARDDKKRLGLLGW